MGYNTTFEGSIDITPPLTPSMVQRFNDYAEDNHGGEGPTNSATWCDWRADADGSAIRWNDGEKFYDAAAWMAWMIDRFIPANRDANGEIQAEGEESGDHWLLRVTARKVTVHQGKVAYAEAGTEVYLGDLGPDSRIIY